MNVTPLDAYFDGTLFGGVTDWYREPRIPTTGLVTTPTIDPPVIHDDTSLIHTETPTISPITSTIPPTAPTTHYTSPSIHTDLSVDDTPDTPPSPTHEIPPVEVVSHPAKAKTRGITSWVSSQHNGVNNRENYMHKTKHKWTQSVMTIP
ncbi:hypothetical protein Tco_1327884 [Tanacetum coccineum]